MRKQTESLETDETCRNKGSGRMQKPAGTLSKAEPVSYHQPGSATVQSDTPDERWVTDATSHGTTRLAVSCRCCCLFLRKIISWSVRIPSDDKRTLSLGCLLIAVWRRNPEKRCWFIRIRTVSTQSHEWQSFLNPLWRRAMAVAVTAMIMRLQKVFQLLKRERIKKRSTERGKKPAAIF